MYNIFIQEESFSIKKSSIVSAGYCFAIVIILGAIKWSIGDPNWATPSKAWVFGGLIDERILRRDR